MARTLKRIANPVFPSSCLKGFSMVRSKPVAEWTGVCQSETNVGGGAALPTGIVLNHAPEPYSNIV
jgi:hypothetical protein